MTSRHPPTNIIDPPGVGSAFPLSSSVVDDPLLPFVQPSSPTIDFSGHLQDANDTSPRGISTSIGPTDTGQSVQFPYPTFDDPMIPKPPMLAGLMLNNGTLHTLPAEALELLVIPPDPDPIGFSLSAHNDGADTVTRTASISVVENLDDTTGALVGATATLSFNVLANLHMWIISLADLERLGFRLVSSIYEVTALITPNLLAYIIPRGGSLTYLPVTVTAPGVVSVDDSTATGFPLRILLDSGADTCVGGDRSAEVLIMQPGLGRSCRGIGPGVIHSLGKGNLTLFFSPKVLTPIVSTLSSIVGLGDIIASPFHLRTSELGRMARSPAPKLMFCSEGFVDINDTSADDSPFLHACTHHSDIFTSDSKLLLAHLERLLDSPTGYTSVKVRPARSYTLSSVPKIISVPHSGLHASVRDYATLGTRLGMFDPRQVRSAHLFMDGVSILGVQNTMPADLKAYVASSMRRRRTSSRRDDIRTFDTTERGSVWSADLTANMGALSVDGNAYALIFAERISGYLFIVPMKDKTTSSFIKGLEELLRFIHTHLPGVVLRRLIADSDPTWRSTIIPSPLYKHLHVKELDSWMLKNKHSFVIQYSPAESQALNPVEAYTGALYNRMNFFLGRAQLNPETMWEDGLAAAASALNACNIPYSKHPSRRDSSRQELLLGTRPDASAYVAALGQLVMILIHGAKSNRGRPKGEQALYICPTLDQKAWLVRRLRDLKLMVTRHMTVIDDMAGRPALLVASDSLYAPGSGGMLFGSMKTFHDQRRRLFSLYPNAVLRDSLTVHDPIFGVPVKLITAHDIDGDFTMAVERSHDNSGNPVTNVIRNYDVIDEHGAPGFTISTGTNDTFGSDSTAVSADSIRVDAPLDHCPVTAGGNIGIGMGSLSAQSATPNGVNMHGLISRKLNPASKKHLRTLPSTTTVQFVPNPKVPDSKSYLRYERYSKAKTLGDYFKLNKHFELPDLYNDFERGFIRLPTSTFVSLIESDSSEIASDLLLFHQAATFATGPHNLLSQGSVNALGEDSLDDLTSAPDFATALARAVDRRCFADAHFDNLLAERSTTYAAILGHEILDKSGAGRPFAGDPALLDTLLLYSSASSGSSMTDIPDPTSEEFRSVQSAQSSPHWGTAGSGGYFDSTSKELHRVINQHHAMKLANWSDIRRAQHVYGKDRVFIKNLVIVLKAKQTTLGLFDRFKTRVTYADKRIDDTSGTEVFAPGLGHDTIRILSSICVRLKLSRIVKDVGGAYLYGTPPHPSSPCGRSLFAPVPPGLEAFGYPEFDPNTGRRNFFEVTGNIPGRRDAGLIFSDFYTKWLLDEGFTQCLTDRKVFVKRLDDQVIIVGVYVDDNLMLYSTGLLWDAFIKSWSDRFEEHENAVLTSNDFCGIHFESLPDGGLALNVPRLLHRLRTELDNQADSIPPNLHFDTPVATNAHLLMREPPSEMNPLLDNAHLISSRIIAGLIGWICNAVRLDGLLGFVMVSQFIGTNLTKNVWRGLMRLGHYLVSTSHVCLCFRPEVSGDPSKNFISSVDSSCLNGPVPGSSYGGFVLQFPRSGAFAVKCFSPRKLTDSSGGAELIVACSLAKSIIAFRMLLHELGLPQHGPTVAFTDSNVVMQGAEMERVSANSRWLAARMAITRQAIYDGLMVFKKEHTDKLVADIITKGISSLRQFTFLRDLLMGTRDADHASVNMVSHVPPRVKAYRALLAIGRSANASLRNLEHTRTCP